MLDAIDHGLRFIQHLIDSGMLPALSTRIKPVSRVLSIQVARSLHFLVLLWFLFFILIHVTLVFTTGMLRNLNHIYAARDDAGWIGFGIFCAATALLVTAWVAATPVTLHLRPFEAVLFRPRLTGGHFGFSFLKKQSRISIQYKIFATRWNGAPCSLPDSVPYSEQGTSPTTRMRVRITTLSRSSRPR